MTTYAGGLRARLISDSLFNMIKQSLTDRGWFDAGRRHAPLQMVRGEQSWDDPIDVNTLAVATMDVNETELELGSVWSEDTWSIFVDFFAENESIGIDVAGDVRDILRGKLPSIDRGNPVLPVFDYTQKPLPVEPLFFCDIENVVMDRSHNTSRPQNRYWFSVRADLVDAYGTEDD